MATQNSLSLALIAAMAYVVKGEAKEKGGERPVIGTLAVNIPTLAAFGIEAEPVKFDESGLPVYASDELNYLQKSVTNQAMVKVRTLLQKNSVEVKPGKKLPETLAEYIASDSDRGAARREKGEAIKLFGEWVASKGKPQAVVEYLTGALANVESFKTQPETKRTAVAEALVKFMEESAEVLSGFQATFLSDAADTIINGEVIADDDLQF